MREFLSDKAFKGKIFLLFSKLILITALLVFFVPLVILPFCNHPFADDYFCGYYLHKGFWAYQSFIYRNWGGRFAATFAGSLFANHNFLYNNYYVHSLLLLVLNFISVFFLVDITNKHVLKDEFCLFQKFFITIFFVALEFCSAAQVSTFIFWFSSAVTYYLPVILIQFEIALLILLYNTKKKTEKLVCKIVLPVFVFIIIGFNELFIIVHLFLFGLMFWFKWFKRNPVVFIACATAFIAGSVLLLMAPGNRIRLNEILSKSIFTGLTAITYHAAEVIWNIFRNPVFWLTGIIVFIYANHKKERWMYNAFLQKLATHKWRCLFLITLFLVAAVTVPVVELKGGIIPERYVNAVICFMLMLLLLLFFITGISIQSKLLSFPFENSKSLLYILIAVVLLCNNYIVDAYKSIIIAPVYSTILRERETALKQGLLNNKTATLKTYDAAISSLIKTKYASSSVTYQQLIQQKPPLLFFEDDLATIYSIDALKKYYGLDSIVIKNH